MSRRPRFRRPSSPLRAGWAAGAAMSVVAVVAVAGCSDSDRPSASPAAAGAATTSSSTTTTERVVAAPAVSFTISGVDDNGLPAPDPLVLDAVQAGLDRWLALAVVGPLHSGQPAGDLTPVFTPAAMAQLSDPATRAALVDEGLPRANHGITVETADATLSSVSRPDGWAGLVAVRLDFRARAIGTSVDVDIVHQGEMVLVPDDNAWKITAFAVHSTRDSRDGLP